jgi:hypothetical protein
MKHRVKKDWLKIYDKAGSVLRVEMAINNPEHFKVRKKVARMTAGLCVFCGQRLRIVLRWFRVKKHRGCRNFTE